MDYWMNKWMDAWVFGQTWIILSQSYSPAFLGSYSSFSSALIHQIVQPLIKKVTPYSTFPNSWECQPCCGTNK